jgi:hypothetical protein
MKYSGLSSIHCKLPSCSSTYSYTDRFHSLLGCKYQLWPSISCGGGREVNEAGQTCLHPSCPYHIGHGRHLRPPRIV